MSNGHTADEGEFLAILEHQLGTLVWTIGQRKEKETKDTSRIRILPTPNLGTLSSSGSALLEAYKRIPKAESLRKLDRQRQP